MIWGSFTLTNKLSYDNLMYRYRILRLPVVVWWRQWRRRKPRNTLIWRRDCWKKGRGKKSSLRKYTCESLHYIVISIELTHTFYSFNLRTVERADDLQTQLENAKDAFALSEHSYSSSKDTITDLNVRLVYFSNSLLCKWRWYLMISMYLAWLPIVWIHAEPNSVIEKDVSHFRS